jgi:hypothetical protein
LQQRVIALLELLESNPSGKRPKKKMVLTAKMRSPISQADHFKESK